MTSIRAMLAQHEARIKITAWTLVFSLFLFFALAPAANSASQRGPGVPVLDTKINKGSGVGSMKCLFMGGCEP